MCLTRMDWLRMVVILTNLDAGKGSSFQNYNDRSLPDDHVTSEWYGSYYYPPGLAVPSPYCDTIYSARFYGFGASNGAQSTKVGPPQTPVHAY